MYPWHSQHIWQTWASFLTEAYCCVLLSFNILNFILWRQNCIIPGRKLRHFILKWKCSQQWQLFCFIASCLLYLRQSAEWRSTCAIYTYFCGLKVHSFLSLTADWSVALTVLLYWKIIGTYRQLSNLHASTMFHTNGISSQELYINTLLS